eukprot:Opistho-2@75132
MAERTLEMCSVLKRRSNSTLLVKTRSLSLVESNFRSSSLERMSGVVIHARVTLRGCGLPLAQIVIPIHARRAHTAAAPTAAAHSHEHRHHVGTKHHAKRFDFVHSHEHATGIDAPLAVVIGWMGAKSRYLSKYLDYYHQKGAETISVVPRAQDVLMPSRGRERTEALLDYIASRGLHSRPLVFHCFSTGGYMYGQILNALEARKASHPEYTSIERSIRGQIFDSVVDHTGIPYGLPRAVFPDSPVKQMVAQRSITAFLKAAKPVAAALKNASDIFHKNSVKSPSLWYYSHDDDIAPSKDIETVISKWRNSGIDCTTVSWDKSRHVTHMRMHPDRYWGELDAFWTRSVAK